MYLALRFFGHIHTITFAWKYTNTHSHSHLLAHMHTHTLTDTLSYPLSFFLTSHCLFNSFPDFSLSLFMTSLSVSFWIFYLFLSNYCLSVSFQSISVSFFSDFIWHSLSFLCHSPKISYLSLEVLICHLTGHYAHVSISVRHNVAVKYLMCIINFASKLIQANIWKISSSLNQQFNRKH